MTKAILMASGTRLNYYRSVSTGAFSTLIIFALCWAGVALGLPLTLPHGLVSLFTLEPVGSVNALLIGGGFAFLAGGIAGAIIAHCYNLAGRWFGDCASWSDAEVSDRIDKAEMTLTRLLTRSRLRISDCKLSVGAQKES